MAQRGKKTVRRSLNEFDGTLKVETVEPQVQEIDEALPHEPISTNLHQQRKELASNTEPLTGNLDDTKVSDGTETFKGRRLGHGVKLQVFTGNLAEIKVDGIVNSTGHKMKLSLGAVSSALLDKASQPLQDECDKLDGLEESKVKVTKGYGLPCEMVLHTCLPTWDDDKGEQKLESIINLCLQTAEEHRAKSVSFPALGAGDLKYPPETVARCFETTCKEFASSSSHGTLKTIKVVIFARDASTKAGFEKVLGGELMSAYHSEEPDYSSWAAGVDYDKLVNNEDIVVSEETEEWQDFVGSFKETVDNADDWEILEVKRVQNPGTYKLYMTQREIIAKKLKRKGHEVEKTLWHGTTQDSATYIARHKFDRGFAGDAVGTLYGKGCYFAVNAQFSLAYCRKNEDREKFMIRAKVITGEYTKGEKEMKAAPYKLNSKLDQYDSVVDDVTGPKMFVTFHDASAYPEYIIKFRYAAVSSTVPSTSNATTPLPSATTPSSPPPSFASTPPPTPHFASPRPSTPFRSTCTPSTPPASSPPLSSCTSPPPHSSPSPSQPPSPPSPSSPSPPPQSSPHSSPSSSSPFPSPFSSRSPSPSPPPRPPSIHSTPSTPPALPQRTK